MMGSPQYQEIRYSDDRLTGAHIWARILADLERAGSYILSQGGAKISGRGIMMGALIQGSNEKAERLAARIPLGLQIELLSVEEAQARCLAYNEASLSEMRERWLAKNRAPRAGEVVERIIPSEADRWCKVYNGAALNEIQEIWIRKLFQREDQANA